MRRLLLLFVLLLAAPAAAAGLLDEDPRLERPVTVRWRKTTLAEALRELSRATGASLLPDRAIVDEPVMAAATGVPARELMKRIASLLRFTWRRSGTRPGAPSYLLFQSREARLEEEAILDAARREVLAALARELERYRSYARMPPEELAREIERSDRELEQALQGGIAALAGNSAFGRRMLEAQALRAAASPIGRASLGLLDGLTPQQQALLAGGEPIVYSSDPREGELRLPAQAQEQLRSASPQFPFPVQLLRSVAPGAEEGIRQLEQRMGDQWGRASGFRVVLQLNVNVGAQPVGLLRVAPEPLGVEEDSLPLAALSGLMIIASPQLLEQPEEDPKEREARLAADPLLGRRAKLKLPAPARRTGVLALLGPGYRAAEVLDAIAEAYGVKLLADAYNRQALIPFQPPPGEEVPLYRVLDALAGSARVWNSDREWILLRSRTWAHDRRAEIPARYMQRWLAVRERKGGFTLDDLAEIASLLRDEQLESLLFSAVEAGAENVADFSLIGANRGALRLYASLLPLQRIRLRAGQPIPAAELYPFQQQRLADLSRARNQSPLAIVFGAKAARTPGQLARAVLSLETREIPAPSAAPGGLPLEPPSRVHVLRVQYPNGEKDEFPIPLTRVGTDSSRKR